MKAKDFTNQKINMLNVIRKTKSKNRRTYWLCRCDCGKEIEVMTQNLTYKTKYSCGCTRKQIISKYKDYNKKIYAIWNGMKGRCYRKNDKGYKNYGARGIKICDEWLDKEKGFINFQKWALNNGYKEGLSIDRINNNDDYKPSNCRWVTCAKNNLNRRGIILINYNNEKICLKDYCHIKSISYCTAKRKYKKGIKIWEK